MVEAMQKLTRLSPSGTTCIGLQERQDASLVLPTSEEPLNSTPKRLSPIHIVEGKFNPSKRLGAEPNRFRVPVVDVKDKPLMPCTAARARLLLKTGKAVAKRNKLGIFYLQLKYSVDAVNQPIALGVDCGNKFEGFSVVGTKDTVLNIMSEATTWVSKAVEQRRKMRRARRYRKTRRRQCRFNNRLTNAKRIPPSTKARWDTKLRIIQQLKKIIPIQTVVVEDIKATTCKNRRRWNSSFSPLEVGKQYFYRQIDRKLILMSGIETKALREKFGLEKLKNKSKPVFETHCVDAWVLAASQTGAKQPTTRSLYYVVPLRWHRRQLHRLQPQKGGKRNRYGGTCSLGLKRGTLINHHKYGFCYVGGNLNGKLSLHSVKTGERLTKYAKKEECKILTKISFRTKIQFPHSTK